MLTGRLLLLLSAMPLVLLGIFGSDMSPRCQDVRCLCVWDIMLRRALKELLKLSKESRGSKGKRASKQANRQAGKQVGKQAAKQAGKQASWQASKHSEGIQSEPCPVGTCSFLIDL